MRFLLDEEAAVAALTFSAQPSDPKAEALLAASAHGLHVVVHHLLRRGAAVDSSHPDGRSALHDAVSGGHLATARVLLDPNSNPNPNPNPNLALTLTLTRSCSTTQPTRTGAPRAAGQRPSYPWVWRSHCPPCSQRARWSAPSP